MRDNLLMFFYMTAEEIRKAFTEFFSARGHALVKSSSLIPEDTAVLLTTAGMQQFKPYFIGERDAKADFGSLNTVSIQKSFRTSDIDEVGDESHLTFFEMLGNFSFGGYWKEEAIKYAHEFITNIMKLKIDYVTVFEGAGDIPADEESEKIWKSINPNLKILRRGKDDNFWGPTGTEGPCGPTTEIYASGLEVWNIVFNQYYCRANKQLEPLKIKGVDTGMGLERLARVAQKKPTIFETDLFSDCKKALKELAPNLSEKESRIIVDHFRAVVFLIADGVRPANKEAGYILRRLIRRLLAIKMKNDIHSDIFVSLYPALALKFSAFYPEIRNSEILLVLKAEQMKFERAVPAGLSVIKKAGPLTAARAFQIASTTGLPFELMKELSPEETKNISLKDYEEQFKKHQELSRAGSAAKFGGHGLYLKTGEVTIKDASEVEKVTKLHTATHLMHAGLRAILGPEVRQDGSDITAGRTRFDFRFPRKVSAEELQKVEAWVNAAIKKELSVKVEEMTYEEAIRQGALGFFRAKYPPRVKVYTVYDQATGEVFSKELCGGPHVENTGTIGKFKILKEEAVSAGVRRIRGALQ